MMPHSRSDLFCIQGLGFIDNLSHKPSDINFLNNLISLYVSKTLPDKPQLSSTAHGVLWILLAMFLFATMDATVKHLVKTYSIVQIIWARFFFHLIILLIIFPQRIPEFVRTENPILQLSRSFLMITTTSLFFTGLIFVPLADAASMMLVSPLIVTALSMPVLKEPVGMRRWVGVLLGLSGALIIIKPTGNPQWETLLPLAAAFSYAIYQISTRFLSQKDPTITTLFYTAAIGALLASFAVPFVWLQPTTIDWLLMVFAGLCGGMGHFALIRSLVLAEAATLVPFSFTTVLWATGYGFILFGNFPDQWTIFGSMIIVTSGLYVFFS